ncbi:hypothetical protein RJT34_03380 [Clitoria ternatea]|uniref:Late embryogenesis abundant protein LEA-2 subgroup domain-containing protein n=1 Tax=Clitoria ternatea TaxID=43366 RepID=A0AAN9KJC0_CLITE
MSRRETNPHFSRPQRPPHVDGTEQPHPFVPRHKHKYRGAASPIHHDDVDHPPPFTLQPRHEDHVPLRTHHDDHFPYQPQQDDVDHPETSILREPQPGQSRHEDPRRKQQDQGFRPVKSKVNFQEQSPKAGGSLVPPPPDIPAERRQRSPHHDRRHTPIRLPEQKKSQPLTWLGAWLCVIFWLVIIIGGLIVIIVYLVFRPQSPNFDVSSATLNAAYLDLGDLLNADVTILANFTNPNKKVHVDFSSVIIYLYYGSTLIAAQYVEPFSAARLQSRFANIHMVTSQVQLPLRESQRLVKQMESNGVLLEVRGVFRARSKLGSILRYSYNLYGRCSIMITRPPNGILLKKKCRTKR